MSHPAKQLDPRSPRLDAAAIFAVAHGQATFSREMTTSIDPLPSAEQPAAVLSIEEACKKQPNRNRFDAADIFEIAQARHPWRAEPIQKVG